jgi:hypothetical protein
MINSRLKLFGALVAKHQKNGLEEQTTTQKKLE